MLKQIVHFALSAVTFGGVLALGAAPAHATTIVYNINSGVYQGNIFAVQAGNQNDWFTTAITGTLSYNDVSHQAELSLNFNGLIYDTVPNPGDLSIGTLNGHLSYNFQNVDTVGALGPNFLASTGSRPGAGSGAIADIHISANGLSDNEALYYRAIGMTGEQLGHPYNPIAAQYLDTPIYLLLGQLNGWVGTSVHAWLESLPVHLDLGAGRTGEFVFRADVHGGTSVPEPTSMALLGMGLLGGVARRKRNRV